jgi:hypothetical protein
MRAPVVSVLLVSLAGVAGAQEAQRFYPGERLVSLTAGVGNAMGWFGVQGERYLLDERMSVFVGLGYTPQLEPGERRGPTFAAGLRGFTVGHKHRLFSEMSASQVMTVTGGGQDGSPYYGPGLQVGYQFVSAGGFTAMMSLGAGYALGVPREIDPWATQIGLGLGYTWRRSHDAGMRRRM